MRENSENLEEAVSIRAADKVFNPDSDNEVKALLGIDLDVKEGDFIVAGKNFGCGTSREHAPIALSTCGIKAVIATSFARIFYRNSVDLSLIHI